MTFNKRFLALTLSTVLAASLFTGCGSSTAENTTDQTQSSAESASAADYKGATIMGKVTSVENNNITISIGRGHGKHNGEMKPEFFSDNNKDSQADNDNQSSAKKSSGDNDDQTPPDIPSGDNDGQAPPDVPSGDNNSKNSNDMPSGDIKSENKIITITIDDESVLQDITLSEITEGNHISVTFDDDGNVKSVSLVKADFGKGDHPNFDNNNKRGDKNNNNSHDNKKSKIENNDSDTEENTNNNSNANPTSTAM